MKDEIFFIDMKGEVVKKGTVVSIGISTTGYLIYSIVDQEDKLHNREANYVFKSESEALPISQGYFDIKKDMEKLAKTSGDKIDAMRKAIIGEPKLEEYAPKMN